MLENFQQVLDKPEAFAQVLAALIGVIGLATTFLITFFRTKAFQKSEKIAEARLTVYLDVVEKYTNYILFVHLNIKKLDSENTKQELLDIFINFMGSCNKAYMVCTSKTKDKLDITFNGIYDLNQKIQEYGLNKPQRIEFINKMEKSAMELSLLMREEIGVVDNKTLEIDIVKRNFH
ncbi:hypothetical protein [Acinetobacter variabilis]|uniref:hypothetical protein n=1 Tax=Acinetobacter variabilis TaxID=70346 RepID=UPI0028AB6CD3|nr:hypothetical protein [Acinetobacter variabilis]